MVQREDFEIMKIGIIGSGQLGIDLFSRLNDNKNNTCLYSRSHGFDAKHLNVAKEIVTSNDVIINCAAMTDVDGCEKDHQAAINANIILPQNLAVLCEEHKIPFIHISTDFVYGRDDVDPTPIDEDSECSPVNFYGETKLIADKFIQANVENYLILRPSWLFGSCGSHNFIHKMVEKLNKATAVKVGSTLLTFHEQISIVNDQFGVPTSTTLIATIIKAWLNGDISEGLYNVRNEVDDTGCPSKYDVANYVKDALGVDASIEPVFSDMFDTPAVRQRNSYLCIDKLKHEFARCSIERVRKYSSPLLVIPSWKAAIDSYLASKNNKQ